jgi:hypothetical protein
MVAVVSPAPVVEVVAWVAPALLPVAGVEPSAGLLVRDVGDVGVEVGEGPARCSLLLHPLANTTPTARQVRAKRTGRC